MEGKKRKRSTSAVWYRDKCAVTYSNEKGEKGDGQEGLFSLDKKGERKEVSSL